MAKAADNRFFRDLVTGMRNGVLAIDREGLVVLTNEEARRILNLPPGADDTGRHFSEVLRDHHDVTRILAGAFEMTHASQPCGAPAQALGHGDRVHAVARARRAAPALRGGALLQGPDARRAGRGARAPSRSAGRPRRDGRDDRPRGEEPPRQHRGHGRPAPPTDPGPRGSPGPPDRHHQRGEDGERHRRRGARVREADPPPDGPDVAAAGHRGGHPPRRAEGAAGRHAASTCPCRRTCRPSRAISISCASW